MDLAGMKLFFEEIERCGFYHRGKISEDKIYRSSIDDILNHVISFDKITSTELLQPDKSVFAYSASTGLGAGRLPCIEINCRSRRATEIAQFAGLYSDRVYLFNFFTELQYPIPETEDEEVRFYMQFCDDLKILFLLRPLLEAGIIVPYTPPFYCVHCAVELSFGIDARDSLKEERRKLFKRFRRETEIELERDEFGYHATIAGPEYLIEHAKNLMEINDKRTLKKISRIPGLQDRLQKRDPIRLTSLVRKSLNLEDSWINDILQDIHHAAISQTLRASFLTNREILIETLNRVSADKLTSEKNRIVQKYITSIVPFVEGLSTKSLLKIRNRENEAFLIFRKALNSAISEYLKSKDTITESQAKQIYGDIISPRIALLEKRIKENKRDLFKSVTRKIISTAGAITFGLYSGLAPNNFMAIASALGLMKLTKDVLEELMNKSDSGKEIRSDEMYFLWKVKQATKASRI